MQLALHIFVLCYCRNMRFIIEVCKQEAIIYLLKLKLGKSKGIWERQYGNNEFIYNIMVIKILYEHYK